MKSREVKGKGKARYTEDEDDLAAVLRMQLEYQEEDEALITQMQHLRTSYTQETFDCSICMEKLPIDDIAQIDGCQHSFCRDCIRHYISSKLEERKYPIPCPCCTAKSDGNRKSGGCRAFINAVQKSIELYFRFFRNQRSFNSPVKHNRTSIHYLQRASNCKVLYSDTMQWVRSSYVVRRIFLSCFYMIQVQTKGVRRQKRVRAGKDSLLPFSGLLILLV